jgi:hypothetical protein
MTKLTGLGVAAIAIVIAWSAMPGIAGAQCTASGLVDTCTVAGSASLTAGRVVRLEMSAGSTALTAPTTADFDAGFNTTTGPTLTVSANAPWMLQLRSASTFWAGTDTSSEPARTTKPAGDLRWSTISGGTFNALTTGDVTLVSGSATPSSATTLYFQTLYDWTLDTPGNYSLSVVLTLIAP